MGKWVPMWYKLYSCLVSAESNLIVGIDFAGGGHTFDFVNASPEFLLHFEEIILVSIVDTLQ